MTCAGSCCDDVVVVIRVTRAGWPPMFVCSGRRSQIRITFPQPVHELSAGDVFACVTPPCGGRYRLLMDLAQPRLFCIHRSSVLKLKISGMCRGLLEICSQLRGI